MILYNLRCPKDHVFETWFRDSEAYDDQVAAGAVGCPVCGSKKVEKAIMAPRVANSKGRDRLVSEGASDRQTTVAQVPAANVPIAQVPGPQLKVGGTTTKAMREAEQSAKVRLALTELRRQVEQNCDYVGPQFAEEARKIHYDEAEERPIYGETSDEEAQALEEEGINVRRIPWLPRENS